MTRPETSAASARRPSMPVLDRFTGDGWLLLVAAAAVLPIYLALSTLYGTAASHRLRTGAEKVPAAMQAEFAPGALAGWSAAELLNPRVDDRIRAVRSQLQRRLDGAAGVPAATGDDATAVTAALDRLRPGILARALGYEQLVCTVLAVWAMLMIAARWREVASAQRRLEERPLTLQPGEIVTPDDTVRLQAQLLSFEDEHGESGLSRTMYRCMKRFQTARDVAAAEAVVRSEADAIVDDIDSGLSLARYAAWAIPSIGFIGTVRGIGAALSLADSPANLPDIVGYLSVAFDTTLIALLLSIVVMLVVHLFQKHFEAYATLLARRCERLLVSHLHVPADHRPANQRHADHRPADHLTADQA